jgi:hypothetical protein
MRVSMLCLLVASALGQLVISGSGDLTLGSCTNTHTHTHTHTCTHTAAPPPHSPFLPTYLNLVLGVVPLIGINANAAALALGLTFKTNATVYTQPCRLCPPRYPFFSLPFLPSNCCPPPSSQTETLTHHVHTRSSMWLLQSPRTCSCSVCYVTNVMLSYIMLCYVMLSMYTHTLMPAIKLMKHSFNC